MNKIHLFPLTKGAVSTSFNGTVKDLEIFILDGWINNNGSFVPTHIMKGDHNAGVPAERVMLISVQDESAEYMTADGSFNGCPLELLGVESDGY